MNRKVCLAGPLVLAAILLAGGLNVSGSPAALDQVSSEAGPAKTLAESSVDAAGAAAGTSRRPYDGARQLETIGPADAADQSTQGPLRKIVSGRRIPDLVPLAELGLPDLPQRAIPLPQADTLSQVHFRHQRFGRLQTADGAIRRFNPSVVLVKFKNAPRVAAVRVEAGAELQAVRTLAGRADVAFAELDCFEQREAFPNDPLITNQWHHQVLGSPQAWALNPGQSFIRIAIVDAPFQMNHPDLAAHVVSGWDADQDLPVTSSAGIDHSTLCAGLAAAVINNGLGVAGMGNCTILPININGAISEMYDAVIWAADHGVRVVNLSWTGGDSDTLDAAGAYLKATSRGLLVMAGGNQGATSYVTNQPDIYCISMTDAADNMQSLAGPQVDFAAPGWNVYSTVTGSGYGFASGTSYAAPVFAGVVGVLFSINPTLGPDDVMAILKATAHQPNGWPAGQWNQFYGWGRINFAAATQAAQATLPVITGWAMNQGQIRVSADFHPGPSYSLWRSSALPGGVWSLVGNAVATTNAGTISLMDPTPSGDRGFYRVGIGTP